MTQAGEHSWDIIIQYHRCPHCGYIIESRNDYQERNGALIKEMVCSRCDTSFVDTKKYVKRFAPLFGSRQTPEMTWE